MKPVDVNSSTYIDFDTKITKKNPIFKIGDIIGTSKYKNIFARGYVPNWSENAFVINRVKNTVPWDMLLMVKKLMATKLLKLFMKKNFPKEIKKSSELKK